MRTSRLCAQPAHQPTHQSARRPARRSLLAGAAAVLLGVTACGQSDDAADDTTAPAQAADAAFPVSVDHKFGTTEIEAEPERIVALGYTELDYVLALGHTPVAARYPQSGDTDTAVRAWAADAAGDAEIEVLEFAFGEIGFEEVAALEPDLILGVTSGITAEEYDTLSQIAPTVAQSGDVVDFGMPWQDVTRLVGRALGKDVRAEEVVAEVEDRFTAAREEHPALEGMTVASAYYGADNVLFFASEDLRARFFTSLGMVVPPELDEIAGDSFFGTLSREQLDLIDTDVLVWSQLAFTDGGRTSIEADPLVRQLAATAEGHTIFVDGEVDDALQTSTVLSLPTALDGILPMLEAATTAAGAS